MEAMVERVRRDLILGYVKGSAAGFADGVGVRLERQEDSRVHKNYWKN